MALFQLDPQSIAARARASSIATQPPTLTASVVRGVIGFTIVSVAGFMPWAVCRFWLRGATEMQMYAACAAVFIALSGVCMHRLIIGPGSLPRFYKVFALAFIAYAAVWVGFWTWLHGDEGIVAGLLGGTAAMGIILTFAFDAWRAMVKVILALFVLNTIGYYAGSWFEGKLAIHHELEGMILWGVCYGIGFGAGLGAAFYFCQARARVALAV